MAERKLEIDIGLNSDTAGAEDIKKVLNDILESGSRIEKLGPLGEGLTGNLKEQLQQIEQIIEKQKQVVIGSAASSYRAARDPETRVKMAHEIMKEHGWSPKDITPYDREMRALVVERAQQMAVGTKGEREKLSDLQQYRRGIQERLGIRENEEQQYRRKRAGMMGALRGFGRGMMVPFGLAAGAVGVGGIVATLASAIKYQEEFERVQIRVGKLSEGVARSIGDWGKGTAMSKVEASAYGEKLLNILGRAGGGMKRLAGFGLGIAGLSQEDMLALAPMIRAGGMSGGDVAEMLEQTKAGAAGVGRKFDVRGLLMGTAMATEVIGRTVVNPNAPGTLATLGMLQSAFGGQMSPERVSRMMMSINQAMTAEDPARRSFMMRALGYTGGSLEEYQNTLTKIEKGVSEPSNVRAMMERARKEGGGNLTQMTQIMHGMGMSMGQAQILSRKYLSGETFTDAEINKVTGFGAKTDSEKFSSMTKSLTSIQEATKDWKDLLLELGEIIKPYLKEFLVLMIKWIPVIGEAAEFLLGKKEGGLLAGSTPDVAGERAGWLAGKLGASPETQEAVARRMAGLRKWRDKNVENQSIAKRSREMESIISFSEQSESEVPFLGTEAEARKLSASQKGALAAVKRTGDVAFTQKAGDKVYIINVPRGALYETMKEMDKITAKGSDKGETITDAELTEMRAMLDALKGTGKRGIEEVGLK